MDFKFHFALYFLITQTAQASLPPFKAEKLIEKSPLSSTVIVAVIDTGVDTTHPELKDHIWFNQGEIGLDSKGQDKSKNNMDDDGNGYVDDFQGWNFSENNNQVQDALGHGTHVSGIIIKESMKGSEITSRTWTTSVRLMTLKYYNPKASSQVNITNTAKAIAYATKMGAQIINYSGGGSDKSSIESSAIEAAQNQGVIFVAAAGNEGSNIDAAHYYPANYGFKNILSVAAVDQRKKITKFSNYGINSVDLAANGQMVYSTLPGGKYGFMSGTSQATAKVSGLISRFIATHPDLKTVATKISAFINSQPQTQELKGKTKYQVAL